VEQVRYAACLRQAVLLLGGINGQFGHVMVQGLKAVLCLQSDFIYVL
jgi:hypothetical protein